MCTVEKRCVNCVNKHIQPILSGGFSDGCQVDGTFLCNVNCKMVLKHWAATENHMWCDGEYYMNDEDKVENDKPIVFRHNKYSFEIKDNGDEKIPDIVVKEKITVGELLRERGMQLGELENYVSDAGETLVDAIFKEMGDGFHKMLLNSFGADSSPKTDTVLTSETLVELIGKITEHNKRYYEDKDKKYICMVCEEMRDDILGMLESFENVTVRKLKQQYLPDKNAIYFMPEPDRFIKFKPE